MIWLHRIIYVKPISNDDLILEPITVVTFHAGQTVGAGEGENGHIETIEEASAAEPEADEGDQEIDVEKTAETEEEVTTRYGRVVRLAQ